MSYQGPTDWRPYPQSLIQQTPPQGYQQPYPYQYPYYPTVQVRPAQPENSQALIGMILCIASWFTFGVLAVPGVILCHQGYKRAMMTPGQPGKSMATVGLVFGWIAVCFGLVFLAFILAGLFLV